MSNQSSLTPPFHWFWRGTGMQQSSDADLRIAARRETAQARVAAMVQSRVALAGRVESFAEITHDARNMVAALGLYCELLEQPGVLSKSFAHYGSELRQVASASRQLVEKLSAFDRPEPAENRNAWRPDPSHVECWPSRFAGDSRAVRGERWDLATCSMPVANLAAELLATRNLLSALAGPGVAVSVDVQGGARSVRITVEDLTRLLVNLVKNAVEAMPRRGQIRLSLRERAAQDCDWLALTVEDNGPGIPEDLIDRIFESGCTGHVREEGKPVTHRGLGLSITRAIVETAGGKIHAENRISGGARIVMELPGKRDGKSRD